MFHFKSCYCQFTELLSIKIKKLILIIYSVLIKTGLSFFLAPNFFQKNINSRDNISNHRDILSIIGTEFHVYSSFWWFRKAPKILEIGHSEFSNWVHAFFLVRLVNFFIEAQHTYIFSRNEPQTFLAKS